MRRVVAPRIFRARFTQLSAPYRVIATHHLTEATVGLLMMPLATLCLLRCLFCGPIEFWTSYNIDGTILCGAVLVSMYSAELAGRTGTLRFLTLFHHYMTIAFMCVMLLEPGELICSVALLLCYFA
eukprot:COSAG01_NODE_37919_length_497_cov_0.625628_1_plen_125_part_01